MTNPIAVSDESRRLVLEHGDAVLESGLARDMGGDVEADADANRKFAALLAHIASIEKERDVRKHEALLAKAALEIWQKRYEPEKYGGIASR